MLSGGPGGGPTTKIHLACDGHGRPLAVLLTGGNVNDTTCFAQVLDTARSVSLISSNGSAPLPVSTT